MVLERSLVESQDWTMVGSEDVGFAAVTEAMHFFAFAVEDPIGPARYPFPIVLVTVDP